MLRSWFLLKLQVYNPQCYLKCEPLRGFKNTFFLTVFNVYFYMILIMLFYVQKRNFYHICQLILHFSVILSFMLISVKLNSIAKIKYF